MIYQRKSQRNQLSRHREALGLTVQAMMQKTGLTFDQVWAIEYEGSLNPAHVNAYVRVIQGQQQGSILPESKVQEMLLRKG